MTIHLVRMNLHREHLMRFAHIHHLLTSRDDDYGYVLHAWLKSVFGDTAPKPFYFDIRHAILYGYTPADEQTLYEHVRMFADPVAFQVLKADSLAAKPMPQKWRIGQRIELHVRACPVTRKGCTEKDVFLRSLDRWEEQGSDPAQKPNRAETYRNWFKKQIDTEILFLEQVSVEGMRARGHWLRRSRASIPAGLRAVERPEAHIRAIATIQNEDGLNDMLSRGIGRHRAFGFGMIRLLPAT